MILLDTTFIVSFLVDTEKDHEKALKISKKLNNEKLVITNAILIETINLLGKKLNKNTNALFKTYESIKNNFEIIYEDEELTERAMQTLVKYKAKIVADAINMEVMKDLDIYEIFTFDEHFDNKEGIIRIH